MTVQQLAISLKGKSVLVPAVNVNGATVIVSGKFPRMASVADENWVGSPVSQNATQFVDAVAGSALPADVLTFAQEIDEPNPLHPYYFESDNAAAIDTRNFKAWWDKLPQATRKNCRRSERRGARTEVVSLDEALACGIKGVYDESPIRQGRRFWHYGKDVATIIRDNSSYLDRCDFLATHLNGELIGFMKIVYVGRFAKIMQIVAKTSHNDARPMNALIAKAVERCCERGMSHLVYSKFQYGNNATSSMIEFKIRNGFERLEYPRYFVPLTMQGKLALACGLHRGMHGMLPAPLIAELLRLRESANRVFRRNDASSSSSETRDSEP
jgi:GNAT acetyltransferase-like protein